MKVVVSSKRWWLVAFFLLVLALMASSRSVNAQETGWLAQYYDNSSLSGANPKYTTQESAINHRWGVGSPSSKIPADHFSARWTKTDTLNNGYYRFTATMDDGMRVYLDDVLIIDSWYPSEEHTMTRDLYIEPGVHEIRVEYFEKDGFATAVFDYGPATGGNFYPNWRGEYFNNQTLSGAPVLVRDDRYLNQDWGYDSPAPGVVSKDYWSARWTRTLNVPAGTYQISVFSDDGVRVYLGNRLVFDQWRGATGETAYFNYSHNGGPLQATVEYYDATQEAAIKFGYLLVGPVGPVAPVVPIAPIEPVGPVTPIAPVAPIGTICPAPSGQLAVVNTDKLNVRSGPGVQFEVVDTISKCDQVFLIGTNSTFTWVQLNNPVPTSSTQYWVNGSYLDIAVPVSTLTVVQ